MQRLAAFTIHGEVRGEAIGHFAVRLGCGQRLLDDEGGCLRALAQHGVAHGDGWMHDAQGIVFCDHLFQRGNCLFQPALPHVLIGARDAQHGLPRFQRQSLLDLFAGQLELVLILVHAGAVVVDDGSVGWAEAKGNAELLQRLFVLTVAAQRHAGDAMDVPVVRGGL